MFKRNKKINLGSISVKLSISNPSIVKTIKMLGLTSHDLKYLKNLFPMIEINIESIIGDFYDKISQEKGLTDIINQHSSVDRLKGALQVHVLEMFDGQLNDEYVSKRERIAKIHLKIGLSSTAYCFAFDSLSKNIYKLIYENIQDNDDKLNTTLALVKIFNLEQNLTLSYYDTFAKEQIDKVEEEKRLLKLEIISQSENLAAISQETFASYLQLQEQVNNVLSYVNTAKVLSDSMESKANDGKIAITKQTDSMSELIKSVDKISIDIERVNDVANKVDGILNVVKDIADQTNLLALNAAIESAKAGEFGKGFSVISYEVRKLATETKMSLQGVNDLLSTVNSEADLLKNSIGTIVESVKQGEDTLIDTELKFLEIMDSTIENKNQSILIEKEIADLENVIKELSMAFDQIAHSADSLSSISQSLLK